MIWWLVWIVLILATLVTAFFLGRDLWRRFRALLAELDRAARVLGDLAEATGQLADQAREAERAALAAAAVIPGKESARAEWRANQARKQERRRARQLRDERTRRRWHDLMR